MKVMFLHSLAEPELGGGAEMIVWEQMRGLRDAGHECVLFATSGKSGLERTKIDGFTVWKAGIRNVYWPYHKKRPATSWRLIWHVLDSYNFCMQKYLRKIVKHEKPDVVSIHNLPGWSAASWSTLAQLGVPTVQVLHDYYPICVKATMFKNGRNCSGQCSGCWAFRMPHRALSGQVQAVVGVSHFILNRHRSLGYFEGVQMQRVIHNARAARAMGFESCIQDKPRSRLRFGYIGRLDPAKGIEPLIEAFTAVELPDSELWIAGSGRQHYEDHLFSEGVSDRIHFLGRVAPCEFYPLIDVVVVPSLWNDNLPSVVIEAFAFGKPVIGSRRGGIPEMVKDRVNGLLFEPDAAGELKRALEALHDPTLRAEMIEQIKQSSAGFTDITKWVNTYESLYREVVDVAFASSEKLGV